MLTTNLPTISFLHHYPKLYMTHCCFEGGEEELPIECAQLLQVLDVDLGDLTAEFIAYDTAQGIYKLPNRGAYLMLIFLKPGGKNLFTTLRRSTPEKREYYISQVGKIFNVKIGEAQ